MTTADLINALCLPQSYPHPVEVITTIETHISIVFLTGPYAYKLKKPVNFGFLDFSSLENRYKYCNLEVKLNKRYAPELYLDVIPVYLDSSKKITLEAPSTQAEAIDYLVKMNQFDPNQVLGRRLLDESLNPQQIEALAFQIASFHQSAEEVGQDSLLGEPETALQPMTDNFPILTEHFSASHQEELEQLEKWTLQQFKYLRETLQRRKADGFVRACHGDLHIDNITLIDDQPMLFDGIEFSESFRWIDVISDIAFLLIDLDFKKQSTLKRNVLSLYLSQTSDYSALKILPFYQVYRALVRAKITTLRAIQLPNSSIEQQHLKQIAIDYIHLASSYIQQNSQPKLILLEGISGSGKSHFASQLLGLVDAVVINSDRVRKQLYGIDPLHRVSEAEKQTLYSKEMNIKVYQTLLEQAQAMLKLGINVIVDATFLQYQHRQTFYTMSQSLTKEHDIEVNNYVIYIETSGEDASIAIQQRVHKNNNPSDADINVMQRQLQYIQTPRATENSLTVSSQILRDFFPNELLQNFLDLPINDLEVN